MSGCRHAVLRLVTRVLGCSFETSDWGVGIDAVLRLVTRVLGCSLATCDEGGFSHSQVLFRDTNVTSTIRHHHRALGVLISCFDNLNIQ